MHLIVLNHTSSAGINGFNEEAILTKCTLMNLDGPVVVSVEGFITSPSRAIRAMKGQDVCPDKGRYSKRTQSDIDHDIAEYLSTKTRKFIVPLSSIAYIMDLGDEW